MAKAITFNEESKRKILEEVAAALENYKSADGKFSFSTSITGNGSEDGISISIDPIAYLKMNALVQEFTSEVAWHGTVERDGNHFHIKDIFVYPQVVTGVTVTPDQVEYTNWLYDLDDDDFKSLRFHGHSHVNMPTSPSGTDMQFQTDMLSKLSGEDYYIFVIWNKRSEYTFRVYDLATNTMYDDSDIDFYIEGFDYNAVVSDAKKLVVNSYDANKSKVNQHSSWWASGDDFSYKHNPTTGKYDRIPHETKSPKKEYDSSFDYVDNDWDTYNFLRGEWE